jgi:hypothetical protein
MQHKLKYSLFTLALMLFISNGYCQQLFGFLNKTGATVIPATFDNIGDFSNGLAAANLNDKWGYINTKGVFVIQPIYSKVEKFNNGYGKVFSAANPQLFEFINTEGKIVSENEITGAPLFFDGLKIIKVGAKYGYADINGKHVIPPTYDEVTNFNGSGLAKVGLNGKYGIINKTGKIVLPIDQSYIGEIIGGYFGVTKSIGDCYICDSTGNDKKIPDVDIVYQTIYKDRMVMFKKGSNYGLLNTNGEEVFPPLSNDYISIDRGLFFVKQNEITNVYDCKNPKTVLHSFKCLSPKESYTFQNGFAKYSTPDYKVGMIDIYGNIVIPAKNYTNLSNDGFSEDLIYFGIKKETTPQPSTTTRSGNFSSSTYALDIFSELGSMAIYVGSTMYVVKIKGKTMGDQATVAARAAQVAGVRSNYKYQWFADKNCVTLKNQYSSAFTIYCNGEIDLGK